MSRRATYALVAIALIGILGIVWVATSNARHSSEIEAADRAATSYNAALGAYETATVDTVSIEAESAIRSNRFADLSTSVRAAAAGVPVMDNELTAYAKSHSEAYVAAHERSARFEKRLTVLAKRLDEAEVMATFVEAGLKPFSARPQRMLPKGTLSDGDPVRNRLGKPYKKWLTTFEAAPVPAGENDLAVQTSTILQNFLADVDKLANRLDRRKSAGFDPSTPFNATLLRFKKLDSANKRGVAEKVDNLGDRD